jgi:8-oxo-dGTP diphosphatase
MTEKEQQAVVAYILRDDGKILSVTRKNTGQHSAPGGKVEPGETRLVAVKREVKEETGVTIINPDCVHVGIHESGRNVFSYLVTRWTGEPVAREPGTRVEWVDPIEIVNGFGGERARQSLMNAGILKLQTFDEIIGMDQ